MTLVDLLNRDRWMILVEGFHRGGWMMWVILAVFVIALIIAVNRFFTLYVGARLNVRVFLERMMALIEAGDYTNAVETSNIATRHPLPQVLRAGIAKSNRREREIERAMEVATLRSTPRIKKGVGFLAVLGRISIHLGIIGMILGLARLLKGVSAAGASPWQQLVGAAVPSVMYPLALGLGASVLILLAHQVVSGRMEKILAQTQEGASAMLVSLAVRMPGPGMAPPGQDGGGGGAI